jgi:hypothetical protein
LEKIGLLDSIVKSAYNIDLGRKGLATEGKEGKGRVAFSTGLLTAHSAFKEVHDQAATDLETLILVEHAYLTEELRHCGPEETQVAASMTAALSAFDDALLALTAVQNIPGYQVADKTWPHDSNHRYNGMPMDSFHLACNAHRTRLRNPLRVPGINAVERQIYEQRAVNMTAAQNAYLEKQKAALG